MISGIQIIESLAMVDHVEDWSAVRSPGRARRRRKKHRQNIKVIAVPKKEAVTIDGGRTMVMHPAIAQQLRQQIDRQLDQATERFIFGDRRPPAPIGELTVDSLLRTMRTFGRMRIADSMPRRRLFPGMIFDLVGTS